MSDTLQHRIDGLMDQLRAYISSTFSSTILARLPADDIAHEAYVRAILALETFEYRTEGQLFAWLKTIACNFTNSYIRSHSKREEDLGEHLVDSGVFTPSTLARRQEVVDIVRETLHTLDQSHQDILTLHYEEGCSFVEIGRRLGITDAAARGRHRNALEALHRKVLVTGLVSKVSVVQDALDGGTE